MIRLFSRRMTKLLRHKIAIVSMLFASGALLGFADGLSVKTVNGGLGGGVTADVPAWAVWDLGECCWKYFQSNGEPYASEWTEGVTEEIDVHFSSFAEYEAIKLQDVTPANFVLTELELPPGAALYDFTGGFDFTIQPGAVIDIKGNQLKLPSSLIGGTVPFTVTSTPSEPAESPEVLKNACFWLDALDKKTMTIDGDGKVTSWTSKDADQMVATATETTAPTYKATEYSIPTVDFGKIGSNLDMKYSKFSNLRTVFWVMQIAKGEGAFFLGASGAFNFSRGTQGQYGHVQHHRFASMWNGLSAVNVTTDYPPDNEFCVYSATMSIDAISDQLTTDRNCTSGGIPRSGGRQLSELICFSTVLSDTDRRAVVEYLQSKWFGDCSQLIVEVPEGQTIANNSVTIAGNVQLVKTGEGTFTASKAGQTYTGGTDITAGNFVLGTNQNPMGPGNGTCDVTVRTGATINVNKCFNVSSAVYNYVDLAGTILISGESSGSMWNYGGKNYWVSSISMSGDATISGGWFCLGGSSATLPMSLNGHTLTLDIGVGQDIYLANVTADETGGQMMMLNGPFQTRDANLQTLDVHLIGSAYQFFSSGVMKVGDFSYERNYWMSHGEASTVDVYGTYEAGENRPPLVLQNGATLDLSAQSDAWDASGVSAVTGAANRKFEQPGRVSFADGAIITVDLGERRVRSEEKIISWAVGERPLANVKFQTMPNVGYSLRVEDDGLYVSKGMSIIIR